MGKAAKVFHAAVNMIAVIAVFIALLAIWAVISAEKGKAPQVFGLSMLIVVTGSMEPEIPVGDLVFTRTVPIDALQVGDVIAFYAEDPQIQGKINTHRIVEITEQNGETALITKGDANTNADIYPVKAEKLVGKVIGVSGALGALAGALSNKYVFILAVMLPLIFIIFSNLRQIITLVKKGMQEETEQEQVTEISKEDEQRGKAGSHKTGE